MLPLIEQLYTYTGEDDECHINGESYRVVETGRHWYKELGTVIWMATEDDKSTKDIDYCVSFDIHCFKENFWKC